MNRKRAAVAVAGIGLAAAVVAGPVPPAAAGLHGQPGPSLREGPPKAASEAAPCQLSIGSINAAGMTGGATVTADRPPSAVHFTESEKLLPSVVSDTWYFSAVTGESWWYGNFVNGTGLYSGDIRWDGVDPEPEVTIKRVGGGWDKFRAVQTVDYWGKPGQSHSAMYGLRNDGILYRWLTREGGTRRMESSPGFLAVKAVTVISETATYDTLLATTKGGALYTIRIPVTSPMKPIVRQVRKATWQGFESLVAQRCGSQGTLLTGVDHDTDTAYLYAVGHANGAATVIEGRGKVPGAFTGTTHHLMTGEGDNLFGE